MCVDVHITTINWFQLAGRPWSFLLQQLLSFDVSRWKKCLVHHSVVSKREHSCHHTTCYSIPVSTWKYSASHFLIFNTRLDRICSGIFWVDSFIYYLPFLFLSIQLSQWKLPLPLLIIICQGFCLIWLTYWCHIYPVTVCIDFTQLDKYNNISCIIIDDKVVPNIMEHSIKSQDLD